MKSLDFSLFLGLLLGFVVIVFFAPDISDGEFFLSRFLSNEVWQYIISSGALFVLGLKIIDREKSLETK